MNRITFFFDNDDDGLSDRFAYDATRSTENGDDAEIFIDDDRRVSKT